MRYSVVVEYDPGTGHFTATVPGLPNIVVDAKTESAALKMARGAIEFDLGEKEASTKGRKLRHAPPLRAKIVSVDV